MKKQLVAVFRLIPQLIAIVLLGCDTKPTNVEAQITPVQLTKSIVFYDWPGYMPTIILEQFEKEFGVYVEYQTYGTQEEAMERIGAGDVFDVVVLDGIFVTQLMQEHKLAELDFRNIPNFKYISPNFRDLTYDPGNRHSIMLQWGITALLTRSDLVEEPVDSWIDLWDERYQNKIGLWSMQRPLIGIALKSLGFSANTENTAELEKAREHLLKLKDSTIALDLQMPNIVPLMSEGQIVLGYGWAFDILAGREENKAISYVLPKEGPLVWGDNIVIPANSANKETAELFINFLFRPEISAQITNEIYVATPNEEAKQFINREILNDQAIFPPNDALRNAEMILSLSPTAQKIYDEMWQEFIGDAQQ